MVPRRHVLPPSLVCSPRTSLQTEKRPAVDAVLKQLRACSRRLQAVLSSCRTELQVLERLYYKGKNQHRTALFWQRVAEMRKLGERVDEMHIDDVVESLRLSFWGERSARTTKMLKGPWTHYPHAEPLLYVLERCNACCMLVDRARERLVGAFDSFSLMMQTGAFLQLVLVLAAVASRMNILLFEVSEAVKASWSAAYSALQTICPDEAKSVRMLARNDEREEASASQLCNASKLNASASRAPARIHDEDMGSTLVRPSREATGPSSMNKTLPHNGTDTTVDVEVLSLSSELSMNASRLVDSPTQVAIVTSTTSSAGAPKRKKGDEKASKPLKKKKKRDEIDDIFGF
ncbi:hypothetical protein C8Q74DRAFT_1362639 [Fomes fomentarius]|nr:hypothetical protein C8Q74DRAFT_1362639 [Fomes fomentarius]